MESIIPGILLRVALASLLWALGVVIYRLTLHPLAKYPGPWLAKVTGFYAVYHAYVGDVHLDMLKCHETHGKFVRYGPNKLIANSSGAITDIYSRGANTQKSTAYRAFEASPTAHDLQSTVDKTAHAQKRRVISQAFSESALRSLEGHVLHHVNHFVQCLSDESSREHENPRYIHTWSRSKNIADWCNYLSFDLMAELVFGRAFKMLENVDNRFVIDLIQYAAFRVGVCLQMPQLAVWNLDKILSPKVRQMRDRYVGVSKRMAVDRIAMESKRQDLFSHILAARDPETGRGFTMDELWGESTLLIIAGSDAISTALAGCFFYLSRHSEAYEKACEEVRTTFSSTEDIRSGPKLSSCTYLRACVDESLRMSPPVGGALWRETCKGGVKLEGEVIPPGLDVGVGIYAIQHNPEYFPSPFQYSPERWIVSDSNPAEAVARARSAFSAFSVGPVGCVGKNLAYMELTLTLARVLWLLDMKASGDQGECAPEKAYLKSYEEHKELEYHLRDRFTSWKDGPMVAFRERIQEGRQLRGFP